MQLLCNCADDQSSTSKQKPTEVGFLLLSGPCHLGWLSDNQHVVKLYFNK